MAAVLMTREQAALNKIIQRLEGAIGVSEARAVAEQALAEAERYPHPLTGDARQAAQRVGAFLAAREGLPGMDPEYVTGVNGTMLTVSDLSELAGLA